MQELPADLTGEFAIVVGPEHTADALGNRGMQVLGTPYVVWMIEAAAYQAIHTYLEDGEGVAGTHIDLRHLAPTAVGHPVRALARLTGQAGRRLTYQATVESDGQVVAAGTYESTVVNLARMLARAAEPPT